MNPLQLPLGFDVYKKKTKVGGKKKNARARPATNLNAQSRGVRRGKENPRILGGPDRAGAGKYLRGWSRYGNQHIGKKKKKSGPFLTGASGLGPAAPGSNQTRGGPTAGVPQNGGGLRGWTENGKKFFPMGRKRGFGIA